MTGSGKRTTSRRDLVRSLVRYPLLAGLGALGARLALGGKPLQAGQACVNAGVCRGCGRVGTCALPQAHMSRDVLDPDRPKPLERRFPAP